MLISKHITAVLFIIMNLRVILSPTHDCNLYLTFGKAFDKYDVDNDVDVEC